MIDLGSELRQKKKKKGISLEEAKTATCIKVCYLQALETNDWAALPTPVQVRGFLRNYATYLELDVDQLMSRFGQATRILEAPVRAAPSAEAAVPTTDEGGAVFEPRDIDIDHPIGMPDWLSLDILIGVALALVVALVGWGILTLVFEDSNQASTAPTETPGLTPAVTQDVLVPTVDSGGQAGSATLPAVTPTFNSAAGNVQLSLEATEHVWVRVTVDGNIVLEGILAPGAPETWQGAEQIVLETANGAGLNAVVNGQPQGPLGERGQALTLAWGPSGAVAPPPTAAP